MKYLQEAQTYFKSMDYYDKYSKDDIPKKIKFDEPNGLEYKLAEPLLGTNKVYVKYNLCNDTTDGNDYGGNTPSLLGVDFRFTYKAKGMKAFVVLTLGSSEIFSFSYKGKGDIEIVKETKYKLKQCCLDEIMNFLKKIMNVEND